MSEMPDYKIQIQEKFKQIDLSYGVSKEEAIIIAQNYMLEKEFNDRDVANFFKPKVLDSGLIEGCWAVAFDATFKVKKQSGLKWYTVHIDKKTGEIRSQGWGPG